MTVRATFVYPPQVRAMFRRFIGANAVIPALRPGRLQPSEGRGQRFESSWVRQFSAIPESLLYGVLALPLVSRPDVPVVFTV